MRRLIVAALAAGFCSCVSAEPPTPTKQSPRMACAISCPWGWMYRQQHICRAGKRYFQDILVTGRSTTRGSDGGVLTDVWITSQGDYPVSDVEMGACSSVIARIIASRDVGERGQHPGENPMGQPEPPK